MNRIYNLKLNFKTDLQLKKSNDIHVMILNSPVEK